MGVFPRRRSASETGARYTSCCLSLQSVAPQLWRATASETLSLMAPFPRSISILVWRAAICSATDTHVEKGRKWVTKKYPVVIHIVQVVSASPMFSGVPRGGVFKPLPPKFRRPSKIVPNSTRLWKLLKIAEFRTTTPPRCSEKGSKILKLPPVRNCFTLTMTNKLVVIINSLKVPKIKNVLLYEMKFLVPNYSFLQNPWLGGYRPQISVLSVLNWICWNPPPVQK